MQFATTCPTALSVLMSMFLTLSSSVCQVGLKLPVSLFLFSMMSIAGMPALLIMTWSSVIAPPVAFMNRVAYPEEDAIDHTRSTTERA